MVSQPIDYQQRDITRRLSLTLKTYSLDLNFSIFLIDSSCLLAFSIVPSNNSFHNTDAFGDNVLPSLSGGSGGTTKLVSVAGIGTHCAGT